MNILYEDKYILALLKDAGIPSQGKSGSIIEQAEQYTKAQCHIISRLDQPVGGIVLLAKDKKTAAALTAMLGSEINKIYYAVVDGNPQPSAELKDYLMKDSRLNISKIVNSGNIGAKLALLDYTLVAQRENTSLLKINLHTGRHHQIRVQLSHSGCPICGDTKYNKAYKHKSRVCPALFAAELSFKHPVTDKPVTIKAVPFGGFFDIYNDILSI